MTTPEEIKLALEIARKNRETTLKGDEERRAQQRIYEIKRLKEADEELERLAQAVVDEIPNLLRYASYTNDKVVKIVLAPKFSEGFYVPDGNLDNIDSHVGRKVIQKCAALGVPLGTYVKHWTEYNRDYGCDVHYDTHYLAIKIA